MHIAIVGGGIGGLCAAHALLRNGFDVTVHEQAAALREVGAGVLVTPNSIRHLHRMGFADAVETLGARIGPGSRYCHADGTPVGDIPTADSAGEFGVYGMHRADLLETLAGSLPDGTVTTGRRCVGFSQDADRARLVFADGTTVDADAVVAADGIHSGLQHHVVEPAPPVYSGHVAYRGLVPSDAVPEWPTDVQLVWMGDRQHFMVYPVRGGRMLNYVGFLPHAADVEESWSGQGDPDELRAAFESWDPLIGKLLAQVGKTYWWGLYDREPLRSWTRGRLALLGDAAHPMLPHLGQGANQTMEDGVALAAVLRGTASDRVPDALAAYEALRKPRTTIVQNGARANGRRYDSAYADLSRRDAEIADAAVFRAWLYDHDVEQDAREVPAR
ncbi:FAD-dependent monooxygenase [Amycolatopsis lexingtonensis]|uniref:FAD-dependent monooxygenase n=1 Tax=Amycolatopsis lexingtonensis TaxID=218822 RepID=UPI003F6E5402